MRTGRSPHFFLICMFLVLSTTGNSQETKDSSFPVFPVQKQSRIKMERTDHDFGEVLQGEKSATTFAFRNEGDGVLNIERVLVNLPIITAYTADRSVNPGDQGSLTVIVETYLVHGQISGKILLETNDILQPEVVFNIEVKVDPVLAFNRPSVFVGQIKKDAAYSGQVALIGRLVEEGKLDNITIKSSSAAVEARIVPKRSLNGGYNLNFTLLPELSAGSFQESITLTSENPHVQTQIYLLGQKLGIIQFVPDVFEFFTVEDRKRGDPRFVIFQCSQTFHISKIEDVNGLVDLNLRVVTEGQKYELEARLKSSVQGSSLGIVRVYTDLEEYPLIHIPVVIGE